MIHTIGLETTVVAIKNTATCDLIGETAILHLDSGRYFGLNDVAGETWNFIQEPRVVADVVNHLLEIYDIARDACEAQTVSFLNEMASQKLVEVNDTACAQVA